VKISGELKNILKNTLDSMDNLYELVCGREFHNLSKSLENEDDCKILSILGDMMTFGYDEKLDNPFASSRIVISDQAHDFMNTLELLIDVVEHPFLLSRMAHILWLHSKDFKYAIMAVESYTAHFEMIFDLEHWSTPFEYLKRAYKIASGLGKKHKEFLDLNTYIHDLIIKIDGTDPLFLTFSLIELILPNSTNANTNLYIGIVDKIINNTNSFSESRKAEIAFETKLKLQNKLKDQDAQFATLSDYALFVEKMAIERQSQNDIFRAILLYKQAISLYRNAKQSEDADRIIKALEPIQKTQYENMHVFSHKLDFSKELNILYNFMRCQTLQKQLLCLSLLTTFDSMQAIENRVLRKNEKSVFSALFGATNVIDNDGKTVAVIPPLDLRDPKKDKKIFELHMFRNAFEYQDVYGKTFIRTAIFAIIEQNSVTTSEDLGFLVDDNILIPEDRKRIFKLGLFYGLTGDFYTALHLLSPQIENFFRELAKTCGGVVATLDDEGVDGVKLLSSIFNTPELIDCYSEDILFLFRGLLNEKTGANIRNKIAHGFMDSDEGNSAVAAFFVAAVIKLLSWYSPTCRSIYPSIKEEFDIAMQPIQGTYNGDTPTEETE